MKPIHESLPDCDAAILKNRPEFDALWSRLWNKIGQIHDQESNPHLAALRSAWIVWLAAKGDLPENFLQQPPPMKTSDTSRTDKAEYQLISNARKAMVVDAVFAKQLERELNAQIEENNILRRQPIKQ